MDSPVQRSTGDNFIRYFGKVLKAFAVLELLCGVAFIILALLMGQGLSSQPLIVAFWVLGALSIITANFGWVTSSRNTTVVKCCFGSFLLFSGFLLVGQGAVVLYLLIAPDQAEQDLLEAQPNADPKTMHDAIYIGRWALLAIVGLEAIACMVALLLRFCVWRQDRYTQFFDEAQAYETHKADIEAQMDKLKTKVAASTAAANAAAAKTKRKKQDSGIKAVTVTVVNPPNTYNPAAASPGGKTVVGGYKLSHDQPKTAQMYLKAEGGEH